MKPIDGALKMAALGFAVFPLRADTKDGHLSKSWKAAATTDPARIKAFGDRWPGCNWGMRCAGHLVLDVDVAEGKQGLSSYADVVLDHGLPPTRVHASARGGQHVILKLPAGVEVTNRDAPLGEGLNVRGAGGYIMAPGSTFEGKPYRVLVDAAIAEAPASLIELLKAPAVVKGEPVPEELQDNAADIATAVSWLDRREPAGKGERGSQAYKCAARLRDWGITRETALQLITDHFGSRCSPLLHDGDGADGCRHEVWSAYKNAQNSAGVRSTAVDFDDVSDIAEELAADVAEFDKHASPAARNAPLRWPALAKDEDGTVKEPHRPAAKAIDNIAYHLAYTGTVVWFDEFAGSYRVRSTLFKFDGELTDAALSRIRLHAYDLGLQPPKDHYNDVVLDLAFQAKRHPVREYLARLRWDGVPRAASLFTDYAGSPDTPLNRAAAVLLLVAAVRRIREPGAKFDYLPVLEGRQGVGKSSFPSILAGEWAGESLSLAATDKEIIEQTRGVWLCEVAELSGMSRAESSHIKAALTRRKDKARAAYARLPETVLRQFVAVATTNDKRYLTDPTGNRRYLPIPVDAVSFDALARDRDQLFAEAVHLEKRYGPLVLPESVQSELAEAQGAREEIDPIQEALAPLFGGISPGYVLAARVWMHLGYERGRTPGRADNGRITAAMTRLGFEKDRTPRPVDPRQPSAWVRYAPGSRAWPAPFDTDAPRHLFLVADNDGERAAADLLS